MKKAYLSRKESIILSAIEIIDELGIHDLSIRELANRQGVSEPALYRHFTSKQDIILAVLDFYARFDGMIAKTIEGRRLKGKEGIRFCIRTAIENYQNYPALTAITLAYDILRYDPVTAAKVETIVTQRRELLIDLIEEGQANGELSSRANAEDLALIFMGMMYSFIMKWRMDKYHFALQERVMAALESMLT